MTNPKNHLGFTHKLLDNKYVCSYCIKDKYLVKIIRKNLVNSVCSYCGKKSKSKENIAAPLSQIIGLIYHGICTEWEHPENVLPYDNEEGTWLGTIYDSYDMDQYIREEAGIKNTQLVCDIIKELSDYQWCENYDNFWKI